MKRVHILGRRRSVFWRHLHPVRIHRRCLSDLGIKIEYFPDPHDRGIEDCDVLIFVEGSYRDILPIKKKDIPSSISDLQKFCSKFDKVIWFDDHDSSGMLRTYVLPFMDAYAKSQLMVDKNYYKENHLTGVVHRDFVNESYGVDDKSICKGAISDAEINKLRVAWNLGLINWGYMNANLRLCELYRYIVARKLSAGPDNPKISE